MKNFIPPSKKPEIILGIDPGSQITGYALISFHENKMNAIDFGCIKPKSKKLSERYRHIFEALSELCEKHQPTAVSVEDQYVHKNAQSALKLGMAKGACIIAASLKKIPVFTYTPKVAKKSVVGSGNASKTQVQMMCKHILALSHLPEPEDASDALALAICHIHTLRLSHHQGHEI